MYINMPDYEILIKENALFELQHIIQKLKPNANVFLVTDANINAIYAATLYEICNEITLEIIVLEPGEKEKSIGGYLHLIKELIDKNIKRDDLIVAFGGGVIGDLTGFVSSTLYRGIDYIQVPTTLLAQVDSSIGSKVAIDLEEGKNLVGSFYPPKMVIIDPILLDTLTRKEYCNGLAEMIKASLIGDKKLYHELLEKEYVTKEDIISAILVKRDIVLRDPFERNERMFLNFGHTFGHAIEKAHNYQTYSHGEAISYGMLIALNLGVSWGKTDVFLYEQVKERLLSWGLVKEPFLNLNDYIKDIKTDKKMRHDGLKFIVVTKVGDPEIMTLKEDEFI